MPAAPPPFGRLRRAGRRLFWLLSTGRLQSSALSSGFCSPAPYPCGPCSHDGPSPAVPVLLQLGPIAVTEPLATTWAIMIVLSGLGDLLHTAPHPSSRPLADNRRGRGRRCRGATGARAMQTSARPFLPLLGNAVPVPGHRQFVRSAPGRHLAYGLLRNRCGAGPTSSSLPCKRHLSPRGARLPCQLCATEPADAAVEHPVGGDRTFSLMVRLFGNVMSAFVIASCYRSPGCSCRSR